MPNSAEVQDRRASSREMIHKFVEERTQMLSLFADLAARHPYSDKDAVAELIEQFCEALIDYTADAHFRIYRHIDESTERRRTVYEVASKVYPQIISSTQAILDFNDKYDAEDHEIKVDDLEKDLSSLGERLADRIEYEDMVITALIAGR